MTVLPSTEGTKKESTPFVRRLVLAVVALNLSMIVAASISIYRSREEYTAQARVTSQNLSQVLEQYITGVFGRMDAGLVATAAEAEREMAGGGIDPQTLNAYIKHQQAELPDLEGLVVADAKGRFLPGVGVAPDRRAVSAQGRDHFTSMRDDPNLVTTVSKPMLSRISGRWVIAVARRINRPDGSFGGMVSAPIPFDKFNRIFSGIDVGRHGTILLRDRDLKLALRYPKIQGGASEVGSAASPVLQSLVGKGMVAGSYLTRPVLEATWRCCSFRKLSGLPYYVVVGLATEDYLDPWWNKTVQTMLYVALFCLVTALFARLFLREWRQRNEALDELIRQEAKYHAIADHTYAWEFWLTAENTFIYSSPSCQRITGYAPEEFYADPALLQKIVHPDDQDSFNRHRHVMSGDNAPHSLAIRIRHADGTLRWIEHECLPVFDHSGAFLGIRGSNRDISERIGMQQALKESEEHFHQLFVQNWDAVMLLHQESFAVLDANPAMEALLGYNLEELRELGPLPLFAGEAPEEFCRLLRDAVRQEDSFLERATASCKDGTRITVSTKTKLIRLNEESVLYCSIRDISDRIRLEKEKTEVLSKLIHTNKMTSLGMLVSGIAHEINNPNQYISLNAMILTGIWEDAAELLEKYRDEGGEFTLKGMTLDLARETTVRLLAGLTDGSQRINLIVNDLKDFSRDTSGELSSSFDLNKTVQSAVQILTHHINKHTYDFQMELASDLPAVRGKAQQIEQVVINLLTNALQALPDKNRSIRVATWHDREAGSVVLTVRDQGKGMTKEVMERITEPFFSTKLSEGGTGLGLSISSTLIREHGGALEFESTPGLGTTAFIRLQAAREVGAEA